MRRFRKPVPLSMWVPDKEAKTCKTCNCKFNISIRRHHCRFCGQVVCGICSTAQVQVTHLLHSMQSSNQNSSIYIIHTSFFMFIFCMCLFFNRYLNVLYIRNTGRVVLVLVSILNNTMSFTFSKTHLLSPKPDPNFHPTKLNFHQHLSQKSPNKKLTYQRKNPNNLPLLLLWRRQLNLCLRRHLSLPLTLALKSSLHYCQRSHPVDLSSIKSCTPLKQTSTTKSKLKQYSEYQAEVARSA